jgi:hypothetical protein
LNQTKHNTFSNNHAGKERMKKIKICILGTGNFARAVHGPSYNYLRNEDPDLEYAAVADLDAGKAAEFARMFNIPRSYGDWGKWPQKKNRTGSVF